MVAKDAFDRLLQGSNSASAKKLHAVVTSIQGNGLHGPRLLSFGDSIMNAIHQLEADRLLLSGVLPMIWQLERVSAVVQGEHHDLAEVEECEGANAALANRLTSVTCLPTGCAISGSESTLQLRFCWIL
jgi:hypothetical protein